MPSFYYHLFATLNPVSSNDGHVAVSETDVA